MYDPTKEYGVAIRSNTHDFESVRAELEESYKAIIPEQCWGKITFPRIYGILDEKTRKYYPDRALFAWYLPAQEI